MLPLVRMFAVAFCGIATAGCNRLTEAKLVGTWRSEDNEQVDEMACGSDHSFVTWSDRKNELTTPAVAISAGNWHLQDNTLVVHFTKTVAVDSWSKEDRLIKFVILKLSGDTLLMKNFDGSKALSYQRLSSECVLPSIKRALNDEDFIGTWRIHYHTRDYEMTFNQDHTCGDFAWVDGVRKQLFTGVWQTEGNQLAIDSRSVPAFDGDSVRKSWLRWLVTGIEPERISIKDGPVPYCLERSK